METPEIDEAACDWTINLPLCFSLLRRTQLKTYAANHLRYEVVACTGPGTTESLSEEAMEISCCWASPPKSEANWFQIGKICPGSV